MSVQVVTVFAPRKEYDWQRYLPLLRLQRDTALHFGHEHLVVTDGDVGDDFKQLKVKLPDELMPAMIAGILKRLLFAKHLKKDLVFLDGDCLVARDLERVFVHNNFDLGLTWRDNIDCPINNGAMYVNQHGVLNCIKFFNTALEICGTHWGADQEAISDVARPVPTMDDVIAVRSGATVRFLSMGIFGAAPKAPLKLHQKNPYVIHFKGLEAKGWMEGYANSFILNK